jgi:tetratricopeptide (TPR) repeat protein
MTLNSLVGLCGDQEKDHQMQPLFDEALQQFKKQVGKNHPEAADIIRDLMALIQGQISYPNTEIESDLLRAEQAQNKYSAAERLFSKSLEILKTHWQQYHLDIAATTRSYAGLLSDQRKYDEAEQLLGKALEIYKKKLGENHLEVAMISHNLAVVLDARGEYQQAESMYREAIRIYETLA